MDRLDAIAIYLRVAELGSFTQAAESLGLPKASVSAAVRQLENGLGTRLLHRTTRKVSLTQDGQAFQERGREVLAEVDELHGMFAGHRAELAGRLRIDLPSRIARDIVLPRLPEFLAAHPRLEVELGATDRYVDLVREGYDLVLRVGTLADSSLVAKPLGALRMVSCASPGYLAAHGQPGDIADLARHRLVHYTTVLGTRPGGFEYVDTASGKNRSAAMAGVLTVNNSDTYQAACLAGLGIAQMPEIAVRGQLADGSLVEVLPGLPVPALPVSLVYPSRRQLPLRARMFMEWLEAVMGPELEYRSPAEIG